MQILKQSGKENVLVCISKETPPVMSCNWVRQSLCKCYFLHASPVFNFLILLFFFFLEAENAHSNVKDFMKEGFYVPHVPQYIY